MIQMQGQLTLSPANQPTCPASPCRDGTFIVVELPGFRVEFRRAADCAVDELVFPQPNGTFLAQRVKEE